MVKILFLAANPLETNRLRIDEEFNRIEDRIRRADLRDLFELRSHGAVRVDELPGLLLRHRPAIVHFSGHGSKSGEIILDDGNGGAHPIPFNALSDLLSTIKDDIRCVVLNSCYSELQAQAIAEHISCVVGMSTQVLDAVAISFAATFYEMLGYGRSIDIAFEIACWMLRAKGLGGEETPPRLFCRDAGCGIVLASKEATDPPEVVSEMTRSLIEGDEDERLAVARELTAVIRKSLAGVLIERSISEPSPRVRYWLNRALGKIATPAAIEILRENRLDSDVFAALGAEDALMELNA